VGAGPALSVSFALVFIELVKVSPADLARDFVPLRVPFRTLYQKGDPIPDQLAGLVDRVRFHAHIVGQMPAGEDPTVHKMGLQQRNDLGDRHHAVGFAFVPVAIALHPQEIHRDAAEAAEDRADGDDAQVLNGQLGDPFQRQRVTPIVVFQPLLGDAGLRGPE